jgi:hypothetical protein
MRRDCPLEDSGRGGQEVKRFWILNFELEEKEGKKEIFLFVVAVVVVLLVLFSKRGTLSVTATCGESDIIMSQ